MVKALDRHPGAQHSSRRLFDEAARTDEPGIHGGRGARISGGRRERVRGESNIQLEAPMMVPAGPLGKLFVRTLAGADCRCGRCGRAAGPNASGSMARRSLQCVGTAGGSHPPPARRSRSIDRSGRRTLLLRSKSERTHLPPVGAQSLPALHPPCRLRSTETVSIKVGGRGQRAKRIAAVSE